MNDQRLEKVLNYLGLAMRARKLVCGSDSLSFAIARGKVNLVFIAIDASNNTKSKFINKCTFYKTQYFVLFNSESLSLAVGKESIKVLGAVDNGIASAIKELLEEEIL